MKPTLLPVRRIAVLIAVLLTGSVALTAQSEATLYRFHAESDGDNPLAGMVADSLGNLYGTASDYSTGGGTIFEMSPPAPGGSWTYTILYNLNTATDGGIPWASLIRDASGNLYGTAAEGSTAGCGTVFELTPPSVSGAAWTFNLLYSFAGRTDGCFPQASLTMDSVGNLYGTTANGGSCTGGSGCNVGIVFELSPPVITGGAWTETVLYRFGSSHRDDGAVPIAGVVFDERGILYGTTFYGGSSDLGTVFALQPPSAPGGTWTEHTLYSFSGTTDGSDPGSPLTSDGHGNFYSTTADGAENGESCGGPNCGHVYEMSPPTSAGNPWTQTTIWAFTGGSDGSGPYDAVIRDSAGNLYGTAAFNGVGGGTVFKLIPPAVAGGAWTEDTLYQFTFGLGGTRPWGNVVFGKGGRLYGTTFTDGIQKCSHSFGDGGCGTVFELQP